MGYNHIPAFFMWQSFWEHSYLTGKPRHVRKHELSCLTKPECSSMAKVIAVGNMAESLPFSIGSQKVRVHQAIVQTVTRQAQGFGRRHCTCTIGSQPPDKGEGFRKSTHGSTQT